MKNRITIRTLFLFFFSQLFTSVLAQQEENLKKLPPEQMIRSRAIDIKHIRIDLKFDWTKKQAYGTNATTFVVLKPTSQIFLDAGMLKIHSISLSKGTPLVFDYDGGDKNDGLKINLDTLYSANEEITLTISYHTTWVNEIDPSNLSGSNGKGLRFSQPTTNDPHKPKEIWSIGDPESNRYWFPCYDAPDDLRTSEFIATVDKELSVISNGKLVERKTNANGTHTFHYKMDRPYANHLSSFVVGKYTDVTQNYKGIALHNYGYPDEQSSVMATTVLLPDMVNYFSQATGLNYPYPAYSQVFVQDIGGFTSNAGISTITENMIDDAPTHADYFYLWDLTQAEALAQQWFGNYISCKDWSEVWLNKSFAHYFNGLYNEQKNGREEFLLFQHSSYDQSAYLNDWNNGYRHPVVTKNYDNVYNFSGDNYATSRGTLVLHMLRKQLSDQNWWKAIKLYVKSGENRSVSTDDFRKAVETASGEKMDWFFDEWIYKMGHPVFVVTKNYDLLKKELHLNVKQTQTLDPKAKYPQTAFFKGKIEIEIDDRIEEVWLEAKPENTFTFSSAQIPKLVNFDFESSWIKELSFEKSVDELFYQVENDKDILGRQSAILALSAVAKKENASAELRSKIQLVFRNIILSRSYWRLRIGTMSQLRAMISPETTKMDPATTSMLLSVIKNDSSWVRASAIGLLGLTKDTAYTRLYINALNDRSDRVISAAAIALGKTKSPLAFDALAQLVNKPSMKSQSLLSALSGLKELGDPRGFEVAFKALSDLNLPRWRLPDFSIWDYRIFAAQTIASLGKSSQAYPLILERFKKSLAENDLNGIFNNVLLINTLADTRGQEVFDLLKTKFKEDPTLLNAVNQYAAEFEEKIKNQSN